MHEAGHCANMEYWYVGSDREWFLETPGELRTWHGFPEPHPILNLPRITLPSSFTALDVLESIGRAIAVPNSQLRMWVFNPGPIEGGEDGPYLASGLDNVVCDAARHVLFSWAT